MVKTALPRGSIMNQTTSFAHAVPSSYRMTAKSMPIKLDTGNRRECVLANLSGIPFDYVPPPEGEYLMTVPFKWPADEEWSRMPNW
jgi:hypothetical protein